MAKTCVREKSRVRIRSRVSFRFRIKPRATIQIRVRSGPRAFLGHEDAGDWHSKDERQPTSDPCVRQKHKHTHHENSGRTCSSKGSSVQEEARDEREPQIRTEPRLEDEERLAGERKATWVPTHQDPEVSSKSLRRADVRDIGLRDGEHA